ncbi:MAG: SMC-Scp complex subunit ScpB [Christensenellales bacterium]|jgi:segregation and condensation protein B
MNQSEISAILEAILFVAGDPVPIDEVAHALNLTEGEMEECAAKLADHLDLENRGIRLNRFGKSLQLSIRPEYAPYVEQLLQPIRQQSLSAAVMETLSIVAYRQPVTKTDIEQIRGVKCDYSIQLLQKRGLIQEAGRRETLGRPILYATTEDFLRYFGIESLEMLPKRDDFPLQA